MANIHELVKLKLGGQPQFVSIHGENVDNPVLLLLHGGPGMAQIGFIRYFTTDLEKDFIVVNWDQRGAGKSYSASLDLSTMNINQFVADTLELTDYLKHRFSKGKIFLSGHSWGTILGIKAIRAQPENYFAYLSVSQVVDMEKGEAISYQYTLQKARETSNEKAIKELQDIGNPPYQSLKDNLTQRKWLDVFGGSTHEIKLNQVMQKASSTKEYNIWDWIWRFRKGMQFSLTHFLQELVAINLTSEKEFEIPIYFLQGKTDYQVPSKLAKIYFESIVAPHKEYLELDGCGHMVPFEKPAQWTAYLQKIKTKHV